MLSWAQPRKSTSSSLPGSPKAARSPDSTSAPLACASPPCGGSSLVEAHSRTAPLCSGGGAGAPGGGAGALTHAAHPRCRARCRSVLCMFAMRCSAPSSRLQYRQMHPSHPDPPLLLVGTRSIMCISAIAQHYKLRRCGSHQVQPQAPLSIERKPFCARAHVHAQLRLNALLRDHRMLRDSGPKAVMASCAEVCQFVGVPATRVTHFLHFSMHALYHMLVWFTLKTHC
jgi:hypothetical protein